MLDEVQVIAAHDSLTGLINRRRMQELLHNEWIRKDRLRQTTTLVMLDLDHFKRINDEYGHHAGDEVLRNFAELASQTLRQYLVRQKMLEACRLLKETRLNQKEIAAAAGYNVPAHFTRAFKRVLRMTPSRFRAVGIIPTQ